MHKLTIYLKNSSDKFQRIAYVNDDNEGIYLGNFYRDGWHITWHSGGIFRQRRSIDRENTFETKRLPISAVKTFQQISFLAFPWTNQLFQPQIPANT